MKKKLFLFVLLFLSSQLFGSALTLSQAKSRNPQVKKFLSRAKGKQKDWAKFLVEYMPTIDLMSLDADSLLAELAALDSVLDSVPWADDIPEDFFMYYVLPYRVSQEPLEYFRKNHWRELWERVKDCEDMECAAYRLNEWAYEEMKYEPTSRWDQTNEQTLTRGIGRCEEMAILYIKACRTMGIPARNAYSPYWSFTNSNHAWVEVWLGDRWHFIGGAEMTSLNGAWFTNSASRTAIIKGIAWSEIESADMPIYKSQNGFTILNLTPQYSDTTGLTVSVFDNNSAPVESVNVWISVFNYSSLRAVAHHYTDSDGKAHFVLGKADLFVSAGKDSLWDFAIFPFTEGDTFAEITLALERTEIPDTMFWIRVRKPVDVEKDTSYKPPEISYCRHDLKQEQLTAVPKDIYERLPDSTESKRFLDCMNRARGNRDALLMFWDAHENEHEEILKFWEAMATKDLLIPDSSDWEILWEQVADMRERSLDRNIPDSLYYEHVANPRILWENYYNWYPDLWKKVKQFRKLSIEDASEKIGKIVSKLDTLTDKSYFGGLMNPALVLKARTGGNLERLGVFVGAMRTLGIPARIAWDYDAAEYFAPDSAEWIRFELGDSKETEERNSGVVKALFSDGSPLTDLEYYENFSIVKLDDGMFDDLTPPMETQDSFTVFSDISLGKYAFINGWRNTFGSAFIRIIPFEVGEDTTTVAVPMGMPPAEMVVQGDLLARKFNKIDAENIKDTNGRKLKESQWKTGTVIIAFFDTEHENSISTARKLANVKDISMLLFIESASKSSAKKFCSQNGLSGRIFIGEKNFLKKVAGARQFPSILLLKDGEAILWSEGLNLNIDKLIEGLSESIK